MPINIPDSATEVTHRMKVDVQRELAESNPFLLNSWLGGIITSVGRRVFDFYYSITQMVLEIMPDTTVDNLDRWASIYGIARTPASAAGGFVIATGTAGSAVTIAARFTSTDDNEYRLIPTISLTIADNVQTVASITRVGATATLTTSSAHHLSSTVLVTISSSAEAEYNVTDAVITVTGEDTFTYTVTGAPADESPSAASIAHTSGWRFAYSSDDGIEQSVPLDTPLTLTTPIAGVDNELHVGWGGMINGTDQESNIALRLRFLDRVQNPVAHFNVSDIVAIAKTVSGVTRVQVDEVTPAVGQVTIYFMRDNDDNPIPSALERQNVEDIVMMIKPANTLDADVIVTIPVEEQTDYVFTTLSPDTTTMRMAITASLEQFYSEISEETMIGVNIAEDAYRTAIYNTVDPETGDTINSFVISAPSGAITIAAGKIGTLGATDYSAL